MIREARATQYQTPPKMLEQKYKKRPSRGSRHPFFCHFVAICGNRAHSVE
jgi:hypothetical protein